MWGGYGRVGLLGSEQEKMFKMGALEEARVTFF